MTMYKWVVIINTEDFNCTKSYPYLITAASYGEAKEIAMDKYRRKPPTTDAICPKVYANQVFGPFNRA
jgi:hypothetical protein